MEGAEQRCDDVRLLEPVPLEDDLPQLARSAAQSLNQLGGSGGAHGRVLVIVDRRA